ncbi:16539_t:CDS:2 [Gigaspora rosea]|nr:16539_t:CDS:2 [Gigaspora rosea]
MNNVPTLLLNDNYFENLRAISFGAVLMDMGMRPLFEGIRHMNLEWDALTLDGFLYALGNVCKNLKLKRLLLQDHLLPPFFLKNFADYTCFCQNFTLTERKDEDFFFIPENHSILQKLYLFYLIKQIFQQ